MLYLLNGLIYRKIEMKDLQKKKQNVLLELKGKELKKEIELGQRLEEEDKRKIGKEELIEISQNTKIVNLYHNFKD